VSVSVFVDGGAFGTDPLTGLDGTLRFDVADLEYLGQELTEPFAIANVSQAGVGILRVASLAPAGLDGRTATFVFGVRNSSYADGLRYEVIEAVTRGVRLVETRGPVLVRQLDGVSVPREVRSVALADWHTFLGVEPGPSLVPGEYKNALRYCDANLSGGIAGIVDGSLIANAGVGNIPLAALTDSVPGGTGQRDLVIAGNVFPFNAPGLGEPTDANPPGRNADGTYSLSVTDGSVCANEGFGSDQPIAGELIPGRGALAGGSTTISSDIVNDTTWTANTKAVLNGVISVRNGATLTIQAGAFVEGVRTQLSALYITREGFIVAQGTRQQPITFTCTGTADSKFGGCWGGLWIAGWAPINEDNGSSAPAYTTPGGIVRNAAAGDKQNQGEANGPLYGGGNKADSSGVLRYAIVEYGGFVLSTGNELNGLTLGGVGSGTDIEFVEVRQGLDDGIELFGGTVNLRYVYIAGNDDDYLDFAQGWRGAAQFGIIQHRHTPALSDKGFEVDNANASSGNNFSPRTTPLVYNFTLVGDSASNDAATGDDTDSNDALHIRKGARPTFRNMFINGWGSRILRVDNAETCTADGDGAFTVANSKLQGYGFLQNTGSTGACGAAIIAGFTDLGAAYVRHMVDPRDVIVPDFNLRRDSTGYVQPAATGGEPATGNPANTEATARAFITPTTYVGATAPLAAGVLAWWLGWTKGIDQKYAGPGVP
jgi:hypothetical protein